MSSLPNLIFATQNPHKAREIASLLKGSFEIQTLTDLKFTEDIPETATTFKGNAELKAQFVFERWQTNTFADDSGLEVEALHGAPGVYSARYAGYPVNDQANVQKLLEAMQGKTNRKARFVAVLCLIYQGKLHFFEGSVSGILTLSIRGNNGFGYDPVFIPDGFQETFAQMTAEQKNSLSHRSRAMAKMVAFLKTL